MAHKQRKNTLFKASLFGGALITLCVFLTLFTFIFYKGMQGLYTQRITIHADFTRFSVQQTFKNHEDILSKSALKELYQLNKHRPDYKGDVALYGKKGHGTRTFDWDFFLNPTSAYPECAGIMGAIISTFYVLFISMIGALPLSVAAALYLEELAPRTAFFKFIEIIIINLAAVPSVLYGLLGLCFFIYGLGVPRSSAWVGGLTLGLMSLPLLVMGHRTALKAVPSALRDGAKALGATPLQVTLHHVLPHAFVPMLTGIFMTIARLCGETAPLLIVGLMAFYPVLPENFDDPATPLAVQIYMWAKHPDPVFLEKSAAAILVLGVILIVFTYVAIRFRRAYEQK